MKRCCICKDEKDFSAFNKGSGAFGLQAYCRSCQSARRALNPPEFLRRHRKKACKGCGVEKGLRKFYRAYGYADGHTSLCKVCYSADKLDAYHWKAQIINERRRAKTVERAKERAAQLSMRQTSSDGQVVL